MPRVRVEKPCSFAGCGKPHTSKGLCHSHYCQRLAGKKLGRIKPRRKRGTPPIVTFDKVPCPVKGLKGPCHIFRGYKDKRGYGRIQNAGGTSLVHKYVWEEIHGPVPKGLELDHRCRVKPCCNEKHLRAVTHLTNTTENVVGAGWQINAAKTHCLRGHEFNETNSRFRADKGRDCLVCAKLLRRQRASQA